MGTTQSTGKPKTTLSWNEYHGPKSEKRRVKGVVERMVAAAQGSVEYSGLEELLHNVRSDRLRQEFYTIPETEYTDMSEIRIWVSL